MKNKKHLLATSKTTLMLKYFYRAFKSIFISESKNNFARLKNYISS